MASKGAAVTDIQNRVLNHVSFKSGQENQRKKKNKQANKQKQTKKRMIKRKRTKQNTQIQRHAPSLRFTATTAERREYSAEEVVKHRPQNGFQPAVACVAQGNCSGD